MIYVPPNVTLRDLRLGMSQVLNGLASIGELDHGCTDAFYPAFCATWARPCTTYHFLFSRACHSATLNACSAASEKLGVQLGLGLYFPHGLQPPLTCSEQEVVAGTAVDFYSTHFTMYHYHNDSHDNTTEPNTLEVECNAYVERAEAICVYPLHRESHACVFDCPLPSLEEEDYDAVKVMQLVLGWFSMVGGVVLAITYGLHPELRKFPSNLITMATISSIIAAFAIILPTFATYENVWCGIDDHENDLVPHITVADDGLSVAVQFTTTDLIAYSGLCTFQEFVLHFGFLASTFWWMIISFNMMISLFFKWSQEPQWKRALQISFQVVGWMVPFLLALIPAVAGRVGFSSADTFCFVTLEDDGAWFISFWVLPVGILLSVGTCLFLASLVRMVLMAIHNNMLAKVSGAYYRVLIFIFIFLFIYTAVFLYSIASTSNQSEIEAAYSDYFSCLTFLDLEARKNGCDLDSSASNFPLVVLRGIGFSILGFLLFLNFFLSQMSFRFWGRSFMKMLRGEWPSVFSTSKSSHTSGNRFGGTSKESRKKARAKMTIPAEDQRSVTYESPSSEEEQQEPASHKP
ncbi:G-protein coupled receptor Fz Smo [Balamuthia mandrillaris]